MDAKHELQLKIDSAQAKTGADAVEKSLKQIEERAAAALAKIDKFNNALAKVNSKGISAYTQAVEKASAATSKLDKSSRDLYREAYVKRMNSLAESTRKYNAAIQAAGSAVARNNALSKERASVLQKIEQAQARLQVVQSKEYKTLQDLNAQIKSVTNTYTEQDAVLREQERVNKALIDTKAKLKVANSQEAKALAQLRDELAKVNKANKGIVDSNNQVEGSQKKVQKSSRELYRETYAKHIKNMEERTRQYNAQIQASSTATAKANATAKAQASVLNRLNKAQAELTAGRSKEARQLREVEKQVKRLNDSYTQADAEYKEQQRISRRLLDTKARLAAAHSDEAQQLARLEKQLRETNAAYRRHASGADAAQKSSRRFAEGLDVLAFSAGGLISAFSALELLRMADQYTEMTNRLRVVSEATANVAVRTRELLDVSIEARTTLDGVSDLYSKLTRANEQYGKSQEEILKITDAVSRAVAMSGATAQGAEGAMIQFAQAITNNFQAAAQEINSINEQTPALADAMARALTATGEYGAVARGDLKRLAEEGVLSAETLLDGFLLVYGDIVDRHEQAIRTMSQGWANFTDAITVALGEVGQATGVTTEIAEALEWAAKNALDLADEIAGIGATLAGVGVTIGASAIVALFSFLSAPALGVLGAGTALSALVGLIVKTKAEMALLEKRTDDLNSKNEALEVSILSVMEATSSWESSGFNAFLEDSANQVETLENSLASVRDRMKEIREEEASQKAPEGLLAGEWLLPTEGKRQLEALGETEEAIERQIQLTKLLETAQIAYRLQLGIEGKLRDDLLSKVQSQIDATNRTLSISKDLNEEIKTFVSQYNTLADPSNPIISEREVQLAGQLFKELKFDRLVEDQEDFQALLNANLPMVQGVMQALAAGSITGNQAIDILKQNLNTLPADMAEVRNATTEMYANMDNAAGATFRFQNEIARLAAMMQVATKAGDEEFVGMLREVIVALNEGYNATLKGFTQTTSTATTATRDWASELDSLKSSLDPVYAANKQYNEAVEIINKTVTEAAEKERLLQLAQERRQEALDNIVSAQEEYNQAIEGMIASEQDAIDQVVMSEEAYRNLATEREVLAAAQEAGVKATDKDIEKLQELRKVADAASDFEGMLGRYAPEQSERQQILNYMSDLKRGHEIARQAAEEQGRSVKDLDRRYRESLFDAQRALEDATSEMTREWERFGNSVDDIFADAFRGAFDSFEEFADRLKGAFENLLAELAYAAVKNEIKIQLGMQGSGPMSGGISDLFGGQGGGFGGLNLGSLKSGWDTVSGWFNGASGASGASAGYGGLYSTANTGAAQGGLYGNVATGGVQSGGWMSSAGSALNTAGMAYAAYEFGSMAGDALSSVFTDKTAQSSWGQDLGAVAGFAIGGPWGAGIGAALGNVADSLFGSDSPAYKGVVATIDEAALSMEEVTKALEAAGGDFEVAAAEFGINQARDLRNLMKDGGEGHGYFEGGRNEEYYEVGAFGAVGFRDRTTRDLGKGGDEGWWDQVTQAAAAIDNVVASFARSESEFEAMKDAVQAVEVYAENSRGLVEAFTQTRPEAAIEAMDSAFGEFLQSLDGSIEQVIARGQQAVAAFDLMSGSVERLNLNLDTASEEAILHADNMAQMAGGVQNLAAVQQGYYQTVFSETERLSHQQSDLSYALQGVTDTVPTTVSELRSMVEAADLSTEAGREMALGLMQLAPAFAQTSDAVEQAITEAYQANLGRAPEAEGLSYWMGEVVSGAVSLEQALGLIAESAEASANTVKEAAEDYAEANRIESQLRNQILELEGGEAAVRKQTIAELRNVITAEDQNLVALQQRVWGLQDAAEAAREAEQAEQRLASERQSLQRQLYQLQGNTAAIRKMELASLDPANHALQKRVWSLQDEQEQAASAEQDIQRVRQALQQTGTASRGTSDALSELRSQLQSAESAAMQAWDRYRSQSLDIELQLLELVGDESAILAKQRERELESIDESLRPMQERLWALQDEAEAQREAAQAATDYASAVSELSGTLGSISEWVGSLRATQQSPQKNLTASGDQFARQLALAESGDRDALQSITRYADQYLSAGRDMYASGGAFQRIERDVVAALEGLPDAISDAEYIVEGFRDIVSKEMAGEIERAIFDSQYTIDTLITFAANAEDLPEDLRTILGEQAHRLDSTLNYLLGTNELDDDLRTLALKASNNLVSTIDLIAGSDISAADRRLALESSNLFTSTIDLALGSDLTAQNRRLALRAGNVYSVTTDLILGSDLSAEDRTLALTSGHTYATAVELTLRKDISANSRTLALEGGNTYRSLIEYAVSEDVSDADRRLALKAGNTYSARLRYLIQRDDLDEGDRTLALEANNAYTSTVNLILGKNISADNRKLALKASNKLKATVDVSLGKVNATARKLGLNSANKIQTTIDAVIGSGVSSDERKLALQNANKLTTTINAALSSGVSDDELGLALNASNKISTTITASIAKGVNANQRKLALGNANKINTVINASIDKKVDAQTRKLALNSSNRIQTTVAGVLASKIPNDVKTLALKKANSFTTTLHASLADGKLSADERRVLDASSEQIVKTLMTGGNLKLSADERAVIAAASGQKKLDLLADVAFKEADLKELEDISKNTKDGQKSIAEQASEQIAKLGEINTGMTDLASGMLNLSGGIGGLVEALSQFAGIQQREIKMAQLESSLDALTSQNIGWIRGDVEEELRYFQDDPRGHRTFQEYYANEAVWHDGRHADIAHNVPRWDQLLGVDVTEEWLQAHPDFMYLGDGINGPRYQYVPGSIAGISEWERLTGLSYSGERFTSGESTGPMAGDEDFIYGGAPVGASEMANSAGGDSQLAGTTVEMTEDGAERAGIVFNDLLLGLESFESSLATTLSNAINKAKTGITNALDIEGFGTKVNTLNNVLNRFINRLNNLIKKLDGAIDFDTSGIEGAIYQAAGWSLQAAGWSLSQKDNRGDRYWEKGDWRTGVTQIPYDGSHAGGLDYVPFDGYVAQLHKGESVLTAADSAMLRNMSPLPPLLGGSDVIEALQDLRREVAQLRKENAQLQEEGNRHSAASVQVQQTGFSRQIEEQRKSNSALEEMSTNTRLGATKS